MKIACPRHALSVTGVLTLAATTLAANPTVETFDATVAGFEAGTLSSTVIFGSTDGNPGGHLTLRKLTGPEAFPLSTVTATNVSFLGDFAAGGITGAGFDLATRANTSLSEARIRVRRSIFENGWYFNVGAIAFQSDYQSFDVNFDPTWSDATAISNGWTQEAGPVFSFAQTLASVGEFEIRLINDPNASTLVDIDNVRLVPSSPAAFALLGLSIFMRRRRS